jgi:hypothetical protein
MPPTDEGLRSEGLREALEDAVAGRPARLETLLCHHGLLPSLRPNLRLAAAVAAELADRPGTLAPLLSRFGEDDAAPDQDRVFLPVVAAHGWAARLRAGREGEVAWAALAVLAADERAPVRLGTRDALLGLCKREGGPDTLVARALRWVDEEEDREQRFGAAALIVELLAEPTVLRGLRQPEPLLDYLGRLLAEVESAPRAAERSDARRRLLLGLPKALATAVVTFRAGAQGATWLEAACRAAAHADVRDVLSRTLQQLPALGESTTTVDGLRAALAGSGKPPRDPTRVRPGTGRGRRSRRIR